MSNPDKPTTNPDILTAFYLYDLNAPLPESPEQRQIAIRGRQSVVHGMFQRLAHALINMDPLITDAKTGQVFCRFGCGYGALAEGEDEAVRNTHRAGCLWLRASMLSRHDNNLGRLDADPTRVAVPLRGQGHARFSHPPVCDVCGEPITGERDVVVGRINPGDYARYDGMLMDGPVHVTHRRACWAALVEHTPLGKKSHWEWISWDLNQWPSAE